MPGVPPPPDFAREVPEADSQVPTHLTVRTDQMILDAYLEWHDALQLRTDADAVCFAQMLDLDNC